MAKIERKQKGKTYVSYLWRQSYRAGGAVQHRTLGNLSHLPPRLIDLVRRSLHGATFVAAPEAVRTTASKPHGHVEAVRQRSLALALIAQRLLFPCSKRAATRHGPTTTLAEELGVADADSQEVYAARDWLLARPKDIEEKLAQRPRAGGGVVLYDASSSFSEGPTCPLACYGHDRDGQRGRPLLVYGLRTDAHGRPVAVDVYPGDTGDPATIPDQVERLRQRFALSRVVLVGDRGMLTPARRDTLQDYPGRGWVSALRREASRAPVQAGALARSLLGTVGLAAITSPDFPGERLVACYNPLLAQRRAGQRERLLAATEEGLGARAAEVQRRRHKPLTAVAIGLQAGKARGRHKMAKHFRLEVADGSFRGERDTAAIEREEQRDGLYVLRTSAPAAALSAGDGVRTSKRLTLVEQAFRCLQGLGLLVRPTRHRVAARVRAHLRLCLLAYSVEWHRRRALKPLLCDDEELGQGRQERDPVRPAQPSAAAQAQRRTRQTAAGLPVQSLATLLAQLGARRRNTPQIGSGPSSATFPQTTEPDALQAEALRLLNL